MAITSKTFSQEYIQYLNENDTLYINVCREGITEGQIKAYPTFP